MASFARSTFSHATYASFRPSYPQSLFRTVLAYHNAHRAAASPAGSGTLLDLGCGHGLVSRELAPHFAEVWAADPAPGMVAQAQRLAGGDAKIRIRQAGAEDLSFLPASSVDLAVAGQAAHWFDYSRAWPELSRVVKPGGSLAFWGYKDHVLVGYPATSAVFDRFLFGRGEVRPGVESLGRFWEEPGRGILRDSFRNITPPEGEWEDVRRIAWDPNRETADVSDAPSEALWMRKSLKLGELEAFIRTYSSFNNWKAAHPDARSRDEGGAADVVDYMFDAVVAAVPEWQAVAAGTTATSGNQWRDVEVDVAWGTVILMARRRR